MEENDIFDFSNMRAAAQNEKLNLPESSSSKNNTANSAVNSMSSGSAKKVNEGGAQDYQLGNLFQAKSI